MKLRTYILAIFFSLALFFVACEQKPDYPALELGKSEAPVVSLKHIEDSVKEFSTYISIKTNMAGEVFYIFLPKGADKPSVDNIVIDKATVAFAAVADSLYMVEIVGLGTGTNYDVYAVATNAEEGKPGEVTGPEAVNCPDHSKPTVKSMLPAANSIKIPADLEEIVLTMSETVELVDAKLISIVKAYDESMLSIIGGVIVSGNTVKIELTDSLPMFEEIAIKIELGAFKDKAGNLSPEIYMDVHGFALMFKTQDYIDMDAFTGAYHCEAKEIITGNSSKYDVIMKGVKSGQEYYIEIVNIDNQTGAVARLSVDYNADTCYFKDQFTGIVTNTGQLWLRSDDLLGIVPAFLPGTFKRDGSIINIYGELYDDELENDKYLEFTFTKIKN